MKITSLGTTTLLFDDGADQLLVDCHVTRPSLLGWLFETLETDRAVADSVINRHHIDRLRAIFISHTHHDHVMDAPYFADQCGAALFGSPSALNVGRGGGVPEDRLRPLGGEMRVGRFNVTAIPSLHSKPTLFNSDLGLTIDRPVAQPARRGDYKEGGSYDFLIAHNGRRCLIRPSFNFIKGQFDGVFADCLFLGIAGLSKAPEEFRRRFFEETVGKIQPGLVVPVHWDNFFSSLDGPVRGMPRFIEDSGKSLAVLSEYCSRHGIDCVILPPHGSLTL